MNDDEDNVKDEDKYEGDDDDENKVKDKAMMKIKMMMKKITMVTVIKMPQNPNIINFYNQKPTLFFLYIRHIILLVHKQGET